MKTRESGMPPEEAWAGFFDPKTTLEKLGLTKDIRAVVDFGCGYGTFTIPAAKIIGGKVYALDIEPEMVAATNTKAAAADLDNVEAHHRDFVADGSGLPDSSMDYAMLFNILHAEERMTLLREAWRVLTVGGKLAVIHWNYDAHTPRGPTIGIRPRPEQCGAWAESAGFATLPPGLIDLPPYHYGYVFERV
ncbi:MAG: class I SAM-dependent methyltransferase [Planctomycetes bacterium]|nr:class I SAM-dependent methyltransferase [Planctomycetota bacterium]